jgi:hypothetical protein
VTRRPEGLRLRLKVFRSSEIEQVRQLQDHGALEELAVHRIPSIVVDNVQIAQRVMREVEPQVRADLVRVGVVLEERVEEGSRVESVTECARRTSRS